MNKVNLCGYLGRDFNIRYSNSKIAIASSSLAITKRYKDSNGNKVEHTDWIPIKLFGKTAEVANQHFKQGSQFLCTGEIATDEYTDTNGVKKYAWAVNVKEFYWLNQKKNDNDIDYTENNAENNTQIINEYSSVQNLENEENTIYQGEQQ
ncbi:MULTISPECIES: single-stranded DNA-binding protein [Campylobacter]|uniref:single-stranded DNA-binding protein n=1 Tax=Campylobacter TaxID=194 RepID=UPI0023F1611D|nr:MULTISPECIES: single-stranded DNA-binding protein [Campylobacter]MCI6641467.1 single-stranded DNA-binding protein [Campylobacter sp.]MDD7422147.1 single-stranded DNA-binding protein [Campylobacter hominis]MDY3117808.1 single-stranded DNA-binding protein [Campylobacter hominis]